MPFIQSLPKHKCFYADVVDMSRIASSLAFHQYLKLQLSYSTYSNLSFNPHSGHSLEFPLHT